jgi:MipA family protein
MKRMGCSVQFPRMIGLSLVLSAAFSGLASAQDRGPGLEFELGAGGLVSPSYEGSNRYLLSPYPVIRFGYLQLPNGCTLGGGDGLGLSFAPSFRYRGERNSTDAPELAGLNMVDAAIELGAGVRYTFANARVFADLRHGVTGHSGITGELGADLIARPSTNLTLTLGPRLSFADAKYMQTYFGVTAAEAAGSSFTALTPAAGFKSAGVETTARYEFSEKWALEGNASWNRLINDAGNSPVTAVGSRNQFAAGVGLVRKFSIDF